MADLLLRNMYFPCTSPRGCRRVMAAFTGSTTGPAVRLVAFANERDAMRAARRVTESAMDLVVGPRLRYGIPQLEGWRAKKTDVWEANAVTVVNSGIREFYLDVCSFDESGTITVGTSYNISVAEVDAEVAKMHLLVSWHLPSDVDDDFE